MKRRFRKFAALLLAAVYAMIVVSPLVSLAMGYPAVARALNGECVGECSLCQCDFDRSASHTCCCWQKRLQEERAQVQEEAADCCEKAKHKDIPVQVAGSRCCNGNPLDVNEGEQYEQLPFRFADTGHTIHEGTLAVSCQDRQAHRFDDPPEPPPKIITTS